MVNYELAKIYKIVDNTNGKIYIGSTCEPTLSKRLAKHNGDYKQYLKGTHNYVTSFEILKNENYDIVLLEKCECITSKDQLHARERHYIENNECVNKFIPLRTLNEWREENKDKIKQYHKQYGKEYYQDHIEYHKSYYNDNIDKIKQYQKQYQKQYREKLKLKKLKITI